MSDLPCNATPTVAIAKPSLGRRLEKPITGLLLTFAVIVSVEGFPSLTAQGAEVPSQTLNQSLDATASPYTVQPVMPDGIYLYGQSPNAEQVGSTYMVFEVNRDRVVGAFYMPQSSFDCFQGEVQPNQMQLTVLDSYEQMSYSYALAMQPDAPLADASRTTLTPTTLPGYHSLNRLGDRDHQILATCKQHFPSY